MPNKFARANGNFNDAFIWSTSPSTMVATTVPVVGDSASANSFTIQITGTISCDNITNGTYYGGTGSGLFNLNDGSVVAANITGGQTGASTCAVNLSGTNNATIVGNVAGTTAGFADGGNGIIHSGSGLLIITGSVMGGGPSGSNIGNGVRITSLGSVFITGNVTGGPSNQSISCAALNISNNPNVTIIGNVASGTLAGFGIYNTGSPNISIIGNLAVVGNHAISSSGGNLRISGNILNAANGTAAIYAPSYRIDPIPTNGYIRYARNGTGVGSDAWLYQYTTDSLSAFSMPPVSSVRFGTTFANATLTGTCVIPSPASVALGVPVDNTVGQAFLTTNSLFSTPLSAINTPDTIGMRVKNAATTEGVGHLLASFTQE